MCAENRETLREKNESEGKEEREKKRKKERKENSFQTGERRNQEKSRKGGTNPKSTIEMGWSFHFSSSLIGRFPASFPSLLSIWFFSIVCIPLSSSSFSSFYSFSIFFFLFSLFLPSFLLTIFCKLRSFSFLFFFVLLLSLFLLFFTTQLVINEEGKDFSGPSN